MIVLFLSILAGIAGAGFAASQWPARSLRGAVNVALGLIGGTLSWGATVELAEMEQSLSTFLIIFLVGAATGGLSTLGLGSLRNLLSDRD